MKYTGHRKLLCELSKLSIFNASILVYKFTFLILSRNGHEQIVDAMQYHEEINSTLSVLTFYAIGAVYIHIL